MNQRDLFLQQPVAWQHAQQILDAEAVMLQRGLGEKERVAFLSNELQRYLDQSEVAITELFIGMFKDLTEQDAVLDFETMRLRLEGLGFTGTLRAIRNLNRRLGNKISGIDPILFWGGISALADNEEVARVAFRLFNPRIEQLFTHQTTIDNERVYNDIMASRQLLSEREQQARQLAIDNLSDVIESLPSFVEFSSEDKRDFVFIVGRILDVQFVDVMLAMISDGMILLVRKYMMDSIGITTPIYRSVLTTLVEQRIINISPEHFAPQPPLEKDMSSVTASRALEQSDLLTADEVMAIMKIRRTTLYRLSKKKLLVPVKIGRVNRYDRKDIDSYLGRG